MSKLVWDQSGEHYFETGSKKGVLYPLDSSTNTYPKGYAWNGLTAVTQSPSGAESNPYYADDIKYLEIRSAEDFGATIEAYTYPEQWSEHDGSAIPVSGVTIGQQTRKPFGFSYVTTIGNDTEGIDKGYKIHCIYNATASPSEKNYQTINENPEPNSMSWEISTTPINVTGYKPTAHIEIDSTKVNADKLAAFEAILYGTDSDGSTEATDPRLPLPDEIITLFKTT